MQVDWISGFVETPPTVSPGYDAGRYLRIGPSGEVLKQWSAKTLVEDETGSYARSFMVGTPDPCKLYISGNPVKLLQGHNAFGSCDAFALFLEAGLFVRQFAGLFPSPSTWEGCQFRGPRFTRIDLTRSYRFPTQGEAQAWIRAVAGSARDRRGNASLKGDSTAVFGQGSTRWSLVIYTKRDELIKRMRDRMSGTPSEVIDWATGVVRFEVRLRSQELQKVDVSRMRGLTGPTAKAVALSLWNEYFNRITFNANAAMKNSDLIEQTLPSHLRIKLSAWRGGADLRAIMSNATFYRVRRDLLDALGVDIASPPPPPAAAEVTAGAVLDPAGWDPEPIAAHYAEPRADLVQQYRLFGPETAQ